MTDNDQLRGSRQTLADVAQLAGVSSAAASLALRGKPGVAEATRLRVAEAAESLGYEIRPSQPDNTGPTIGLVVKSRSGEAETTNKFYGPIMAGISEAAARVGLPVKLSTLPVDEHFEPLGEPILARDETVDGLLILGAYLSERAADGLGTKPVILVDGYTAEPDRYSSVVTDNMRGIRAATEHVLAHGHRRVLLAGANQYPSIAERHRGYLEAVSDIGLVPLVLEGDHDGNREFAIQVVDTVEQDPEVTAVVAVNDTVAVSVLQELQRRRISVPDQVSVVGFDDIDVAAMMVPGLDTAAVDKAAMGRLSLSLLLHQIEYPSDAVHTTTLATTLRVRGSVGPAPSK